MGEDLGRDLCGFVEASPTPFHAVAEMARRLDTAGFTPLDERARWSVGPGARHYVVRDGGTIAAFRVGSAPAGDAGFRLVGAHTDAPTFKVRPLPDVRRAGYRQVGVEPYGGVLAHTWLDRDLTIAGRVAVRDADGIALPLVRLPGAPVRIPSLAIHLYRELREEGLKLDPQRHLVPVLGPEGGEDLRGRLGRALDVAPEAVLAYDLVLADTQPPGLGGDDEAYVFAPRMDNLVSCHTGLHALLGAEQAAATQVLVANDHEEVGSGSAEGAAGSFLEDLLRRLVAGTGGEPQDFERAAATSVLVSSDMAHALHPNYADRHEGDHTPRLGGGPVLKSNANQAYATDARSGGWFAARCADAGVPLQHFVTRADLPCGSTIGPLTATRLGVATVDVGNPLLSMHSCREQTAVADLAPMVGALSAHFSAPGVP